MAILSSLFGAQQQQPAVGAQPITTSEIPKQLAPYYEDILSKAQALYNKRVEEGFKPYEGPTIAQFTPEQEATFAGIAGLQGQVAPKFAEAEQLTRDAAARITGEQLQEAMSPYQQAVTDIEKRESQKAFEQNVLPKLRAAQVAQGSFGGTRGTLLEAQAIADQQRALADIQAKGSAAAFKDARAALEAERTRMGQGATQLANIAPAALKTGLAELGAQQTVGETKQRQAQTALDEAYRQFLQEKQEPYEAMQKYQAVVTGAPLTTTQFAQPAPPGPSLGQTLIGGLGTAAGLYGAFTGQNPLTALTGKKTGGGIADALPLINKRIGGDFSFLRPTQKQIDRRNRISGAIQDRVKAEDTTAFVGPGGIGVVVDADGNVVQTDVPGQQAFIGPDGAGVVVDADDNVIRTDIPSEVQKTVGTAPAGGPIKKEGIASLETKPEPKPKADQPPAPTTAQLREQAIRTEEEGLKSLYGQYAQRAEKEKAESKDSEYREQMANMAKAFAQFATKGGEGNILQKAIGTAGDNVDSFVGTSNKFRKERKAIEKDLQAGKLAEARLKYDITKDRATREIAKEDKEYTRKTAKAAAEYQRARDRIADEFKTKEFQLKRDEINQKIRKDQEVNASDIKNIRDVVASRLGFGKDTGGGIVGADGTSLSDKELAQIESATKGVVDLIKISQNQGSPIDFDVASRIQAKATSNNLSSNATQLLISQPDAVAALKRNMGSPKEFADQFGITESEATIIRG